MNITLASPSDAEAIQFAELDSVPAGDPPTLPPALVPFEDERPGANFDAFMGFYTADLAGPIVVEFRAPKTPIDGKPYTLTEYAYFHINSDPKSWAKLRAAVAGICCRPARLQPPGGYLIINPVCPDLLARANGKLERAKGDGATSAEDVTARRHFPVDVDSVRRTALGKVLSGVCATEEEKAHAEKVARAVVNDLRSRGWPEPAVVDTGNGYTLWYAADLPARDGGLVEAALKALAARHDSPDAKVDTSVFDPSRIMRLPGTWNRKGSDSPEVRRPHRRCEIQAIPGERRVVPRELIEALAAERCAPEETSTEAKGGLKPSPAPPPAPKPQPSNVRYVITPKGRKVPIAEAVSRCRGALKKVPRAIEGENGSSRTINACRLAWNDFGLDYAHGFPLIEEYNSTCVPPWPLDGSQGLQRKWEEAEKKGPGPEDRGFLLDEGRGPPRHAPLPTHRAATTTPDNASGGTLVCTSLAWRGGPGVNASPDNPHRLARGYLGVIDPEEKRLLRYWRGEFWLWSDGAYRAVPRDDLRAQLACWLEIEMERVYEMEKRRSKEGDDEDDRRRDKKGDDDGEGGDSGAAPVTRAMVDNTTQAMGGLCHLAPEIEPPAWVDGQSGAEPSGVLSMRNGLLDLASAADAKPDCLLPLNPSFFTLNAAPIDYAPDAPEPVEWLKFLGQLWPSDSESIEALQEWFGLLLTPDTTYQKILMLLGPRRSGKGTIARVLKALVGEANYAGPTLSGLAGEFGLSPLLGKSVAVISDARLSGRTDTATVTERLLAISGEDTITVNRKGISMLTVKLPTRFIIISNELPRLSDAAGALVGRLILLKMTNSFYGKEDKKLSAKIVAELPGILKWAIEGWRQLRDCGRLSQPASGTSLLETMADLSSPINQFVRERCVTGDDNTVSVADLYRAWTNWCSSKGKKEPGTDETFGRDLRAAFPHIDKTRPQIGSKRVNTYSGIRLRTERDQDEGGPEVRHSAVTAASQQSRCENAGNPGPVIAVTANPHLRAIGEGENRACPIGTAMPCHGDSYDGEDFKKKPDATPFSGFDDDWSTV